MRHYFTTLDKAFRVAALASKAERDVFEVVGKGFIVGRTAYADELKYAADHGQPIYTRLMFPR